MGNISIQSIMLFQPIIENAILYGLKPKIGDKQLNITLKGQGEMIEGVIKDNDIGREASLAMKKTTRNYKSWATEIMNERIGIFNTQHKQQISFTTIDLKEGERAFGTEVCLKISFNS